MKYARLTALSFLIGLMVSCSEKAGKATSGLTDNQRFIVSQFNAVRSLQNQKTDSAHIAAIDKAAVAEPAEYQAMAHLAWGIYYNGTSSYELALKNFEKALWKVKRPEADTLKALALSGIGNSYKHTADYPKALRYLYKSLDIFENHKDSVSIARVNSFIGDVHVQKSDFASAKENLKIALRILDNDKGQAGWLNAAHTLANVYGMSGDYKNALKIDSVGIKISDSINSPLTKSMFLDNKANCYMFSGRLDSAEYYFNECLKLDLKSGSKKQIADSYSNLGNLASFRGDFDKAEALTLKSIEILKGVNHKFNLGKSYQILSEIYTRKGDYKKAAEAHLVFFDEYKKAVNEKKEASLAEFRILHETDRKEKELAESKVALLEKNAEVRNRNNLLIVLSLVAFFIALIGLMINRQHKLRNRQLAQEHELKTAIAQIETQNQLQRQRLEISRDLHDNIGAQLTFIISSVDNIKYAFDLKNSKLDAKLQNISTFAKETIVELRDTIWAMNHNVITLEDLRIRIMNFIDKAKEAKQAVSFRFNMPEDLGEMPFNTLIGMNIYRTIQEAVNNAIKYSGATMITIDIVERQPGTGMLDITIADNGSGFDIAKVEKGNGLSNMEKRIAGIGGELEITTSPGNGTIVQVRLPGNPNKE